ncbi:hypothetical protein EDB98_10822 [Pseudomonas fluorescens]|jgi:hypothetical protein|nr:hypothetical protein EDB98_10822 [Pseudomonas fluorescens]
MPPKIYCQKYQVYVRTVEPTENRACFVARGFIPAGPRSSPNSSDSICLTHRGVRFGSAAQPSGSKLPRHVVRCSTRRKRLASTGESGTPEKTGRLQGRLREQARSHNGSTYGRKTRPAVRPPSRASPLPQGKRGPHQESGRLSGRLAVDVDLGAPLTTLAERRHCGVGIPAWMPG